MSTTGTFVLGLGCQKGGTTWLGRYLETSPEYHGGFRKEYHVFDYPDLRPNARDFAIEQSGAMLQKLAEGRNANAPTLLWPSFYQNRRNYYDYFGGLLTRPGVRATGDITPLYSRLPAEQLAEIKEKFAERGIRTVALFMMRDPLERVWSMARMHRRGTVGGPTPEQLVERNYLSEGYSDRTRYDKTLAAIDAVFDPEDVHVEFYERLFDVDRLRALTDRIGITFPHPDFEKRANITAKEGSLGSDLERTVAEHFRPVYEAVAARFPDLDLEALWPSMRLLDPVSEAVTP